MTDTVTKRKLEQTFLLSFVKDSEKRYKLQDGGKYPTLLFQCDIKSVYENFTTILQLLDLLQKVLMVLLSTLSQLRVEVAVVFLII